MRTVAISLKLSDAALCLVGLACRQSDGPGGLRLSLDQGGGHIVTLQRAALAAVARAHAVAAVVEDAAHQ
jgi:hypothetical protein